MQCQILVFFKGEIGTVLEPSPSTQALLYLTYLGLIFSVSAALSSLILTDEMGSVHVRAARYVAANDGHLLELAQYDEPSSDMLSRFNGGHSSWRWVVSHCKRRFMSLVRYTEQFCPTKIGRAHV